MGSQQFRFFTGITERAFIGDLKQVSAYFNPAPIAYLDNQTHRQAIVARVQEAITPETRILIAHSLGSVAAYEALLHYRPPNIRLFVTLGSPLGISNLIFHRLNPTPQDGQGHWPPGIRRWVNVADRGDVVALVKKLAPLFGPGIEDHESHNGSHAHNAAPYLRAEPTARAIAEALRDES